MSDLHLIALGGTISMRPSGGGAVPVSGAERLAARVEGFGSSEDLALVGGSEVSLDLLEELSARCSDLADAGTAGVVVTTGTDSIEELVSWVTYRRSWPMPIVVTGSMVPGERFDSDGTANLADAAAVGLASREIDPVVVFGGRIYAGREVLKESGVERDAFGAPRRGALGTVGGGHVQWLRQPPRGPSHGAPTCPVVPVPIVVAALADDGALLRAAGAGRTAVVVAANGAGNLPPGQAVAAGDLMADGTLVVITTRAPDARVAPIYGYPGGSARLEADGAVLAPGLTPHRARLLVTLGLAQGRNTDQIRTLIALEATG